MWSYRRQNLPTDGTLWSSAVESHDLRPLKVHAEPKILMQQYKNYSTFISNSAILFSSISINGSALCLASIHNSVEYCKNRYYSTTRKKLNISFIFRPFQSIFINNIKDKTIISPGSGCIQAFPTCYLSSN